jgi:hypothetical protein
MLTDTIKSTFKDAAKKLTGNRKRDFMAKVTEDYFDSSARQAETVPRRYSARQLSYKLATERKVNLGAEQVRRILKKKL